MKITRAAAHKIALPDVSGAYAWGAGNVIFTATLAYFADSTPEEFLVNATDLHNYNTRSSGTPGPETGKGKLYASDTPGLGVEPDFDSLGAPVAVYGDGA